MDDHILLVGGIILGTFVVTGALVLLMVPRGKQAETLVDAGNTFELQSAPADSKQYKLFARYGVEWEEGGKRGYGLTFELKVLVDGKVAYEGKLGVGQNTPDDVEYASGSEYFTSSSSSPSGYGHVGTVGLLELGQRTAGSSIVVTGMVVPAPNTAARPTKIYIAR